MDYWWIGGIGLGVTLVVVFGLMFSHARVLWRHTQDEWEKLRELLSLRADYLPNLIETVKAKTEGQEAVIQQVIEARKVAEHVHVAGLEKFESEMRLSNAVREMQGLTREFSGLARDTNFLELKSDLKEVAREIEYQTSVYNNAVRKHNRFARIVPFQARVPIFEFEG